MKHYDDNTSSDIETGNYKTSWHVLGILQVLQDNRPLWYMLESSRMIKSADDMLKILLPCKSKWKSLEFKA